MFKLSNFYLYRLIHLIFSLIAHVFSSDYLRSFLHTRFEPVTMASADVDWAGAADAQEKALRQMDR